MKNKDLEKSLDVVASLKETIKFNDSLLEMLFDTVPCPIFYKDTKGV